MDRSLEPEVTAGETPEPSPTVTIIKTKGKLKCRKATQEERDMLSLMGALGDRAAFAVDLGQGWRILSWSRPAIGGGTAHITYITNG